MGDIKMLLATHLPYSLLFLAQTSLTLSRTLAASWPHTDCIQANEQCISDQSCSSRLRTLRQCLAGRDRDVLLSSQECKTALEVLQESALYMCRCRRGMKKELQCLQVYWGIHAGLTDGDEFYESSPYEPVASRLSDIFRLASINSGTEATAIKQNACLDAAKFCNVNDACKKLRSTFISVCTSGGEESCPRRKCQKSLRTFLERIPLNLTYPLLFCPCGDKPCAERRRQTIVPSCSFNLPEVPNCLEVWSSCRQDPVCRSRLADFVTNCQSSPQSASGCVRDNYAACLGAYAGLIGYDVALNFLDSEPHSLSIGPWCSCSSSGAQESMCELYLKEFTQNRCLRNAIYAFGNGTDVVHKESAPRPPLTTIAPRTEKRHVLPDNQSDSNTLYEMNPDICDAVQDKKNDSSPHNRICVSESQLNPNLAPDLRIDEHNAGISQHHASMLSIVIALYLATPF
ncbi:GDNF family receptor alpha-2 [Hyla sarda]|uniref:GDNF family receptor alpha-2 n=1 Tax=Hyla sarda TaxID=327740 RepID=UPI0024C379FC|nr:GDNF family receptor alpha-2 [Hyla sarda]